MNVDKNLLKNHILLTSVPNMTIYSVQLTQINLLLPLQKGPRSNYSVKTYPTDHTSALKLHPTKDQAVCTGVFLLERPSF